MLDTDAIAAVREAARHKLNGEAKGFDLQTAIRAEFANAGEHCHGKTTRPPFVETAIAQKR